MKPQPCRCFSVGGFCYAEFCPNSPNQQRRKRLEKYLDGKNKEKYISGNDLSQPKKTEK